MTKREEIEDPNSCLNKGPDDEMNETKMFAYDRTICALLGWK